MGTLQLAEIVRLPERERCMDSARRTSILTAISLSGARLEEAGILGFGDHGTYCGGVPPPLILTLS
jgi:hypothetical protein